MPPPAPPPPLPGAAEYKKLHRELWIFFVFLGLLLGVAAWFLINGDFARGAPKLWGYPRQLAIGVPLAGIAGGYLFSGVLLALFRSRFFCILGGLVSVSLTVFYIVFMISATGEPPGLNLMTVVIAAIPVLVWIRAIQFMKLKPGS